jgi:hypothetical protein
VSGELTTPGGRYDDRHVNMRAGTVADAPVEVKRRVVTSS